MAAVYMGIIGFLVLIIHRVSLLITFPQRFKLPYTIAFLLLALFLTMIFRETVGQAVGWNALTTLFNCALMCWLLRGSVFQITFAFYFQYILIISLWYLAEAVLGVFISPDDANFSLTLFVAMIALYTAFVALAVAYGRKLFKKLLEYGGRAEWSLYASGALYSFVFLTISRDFPGSKLQYILLILFVIWSFAVFCLAIINIHEKTKKSAEAEFASGIISSGRDHYQKMDGLQEKLRILRHDYKYHITAIGELAASGDNEGIARYLSGIQEHLSESEMREYCTNNVINALLSSYAERCAKSDTRYGVEVSLPQNLTIPNYDLCIILGNLLENAMEACGKLTEGKYIEIRLKPLGEQLALIVSNSFDGKLGNGAGRLESAKKDGGYGLKSVEAVAVRYDGELTLEWNADTFTAGLTVKL